MQNTELAVIQGGVPQARGQSLPDTLTPDRIELIKRTVCKGSTDDELSMFLARCRQTGLDPMTSQIHAVFRWDGRLKREVMSIQTGIDGYRLIAERTGHYVPGPEPVFTYDAQGHLASATAYVKKWAMGEWHVVAATAFYEEYVQTDRDGNPNSIWKRRPRGQLSKCAESLALRLAFPAEMSGLHTNEEMGQADNELAPPYGQRATPRHPETLPPRTIEGEVVDEQTGEITPAPAPPPARTQQAPPPHPQTSPAQPVQQPAADAPTACEVCNLPLKPGQVTVSQGRFKRSLCPEHQRATAAQPQAPTGEPQPPAAQPPTIDAPVAEDAVTQELRALLQAVDDSGHSLDELNLDPEGELIKRLQQALDDGMLYVEARLANYPPGRMQNDIADLHAGLVGLGVDLDDGENET